MRTRYPDADMEQVSASFRTETIQIFEEIMQRSRDHSEMWDMSRSETVRTLVNYALDHIDGLPEIEELIPESAIEAWQRQRRHEERVRKSDRIEIREGWRGRVSNRFDKRLRGDEPYSPEGMAQLAESYFADFEDVAEDPEEIEEAREWLDRKIERYRQAYDAKQLAPDESFTDTHSEVQLGADLWSLREDQDQVVADLVGAIESDHTDPDALVTKLSKEWAVEEGSVWTLIDLLSPEDADERALLSGDADRDLSESINPDRSELIDPDLDPELLAPDPDPAPEPTTPEETPETPTETTSAPTGISDGGKVIDQDSTPEFQRDQGPNDSEPTEELIEEAVELIEEGVPVPSIPVQLYQGDDREKEQRAIKAAEIARERTEGDR